MANIFFFRPLLVIVYALPTVGRLITVPLNKYSFSYTNFTMTCSSTRGSSSITWFFTPAGDSVNMTIASGSQVYPAFTHLYWIDQPITDYSNLVIRTANESACGTFTCSDTEMIASAQLIMWRSNKVVPSFTSADSLIIGDVVRYNTEVTYFGNPFFYPIIYVQRFPEIIANVTSTQLENLNSTINATGTYYHTVSCPSIQNSQFLVGYGQPVGNLPPGSATNAPDGTPATGFNVVTLSCIPSISGAVSGAAIYPGTTLVCNLASKVPVNYSWTDLSNNASSNGPQLTVWRGGSYNCTASFEISGLWNSGTVSIYNLTVQNQSSGSPSSSATDISSTTKPTVYGTDLSCTVIPLYGPIAGGTIVTLTFENWPDVIANISAVYFGGFMKITSLQGGRLDNSVVMTTPFATAALIGQPLPIIVEFTPWSYNRSTNASFTYEGNPEITDINPSTFVITGGTIMTATGTRLSSVAYPLIQVTLVVERGIERNATTEKSIEPCEVKAEDSSHMTCRMPSMNIPDDFLKVLDSQYNNRSKRDTDSMLHPKAENQFLLSRRKRYANALSLTGPNGVDQLTISLGFILDGYQTYENINKALPDTQILIFSSPEINFTKDILEFDPDRDDSISIKGKHMTRGCRMADYMVQIGAELCENIDLTDNQLRCRPPKRQPEPTKNVSINCDQLLGIYIQLGYKTYQYACMKYSTRPLALIIGLAVGLSSFVIIIILIIVIVCCCKRSRNRRNKPTNKTLDRNTAAANEAYEPPSGQLYDNAAYSRPMDADDVYANAAYSRPAVQSLYANDEYEPPSIQLYANASELRRIDKHA